MFVATWNLNGIRARQERFFGWLETHRPDVLCLQEIKASEEHFPFPLLQMSGYHAVAHGQKGRNGVAILATEELTEVQRGFGDGVEDPQARFIAAKVNGVRIISAYFPTGWPIGSEKYDYKRQWNARLLAYLERTKALQEPTLLCGDFNLTSMPSDVANPDEWEGTAVSNPEMRAWFQGLIDLGWQDTYLPFAPEEPQYTWWDATKSSFERNDGMRIDFILASPPLSGLCLDSKIDLEERARRSTSDHAPHWSKFQWPPGSEIQVDVEILTEQKSLHKDEDSSEVNPSTTDRTQKLQEVITESFPSEKIEFDLSSFVHLHVHSHYSLLQGAGQINGLVNRAKELGMTSLALTDNGNLYGALQFYQACKSADIKPILGYEANVAPGSRFEKKGSGIKGSSFRITLLAQNLTGFKNLVKLSSRAYLEGFYYRPRIDKELLTKYSEGLVCLSGDVLSEFTQGILHDKSGTLEDAKHVARWYQQLFGDRYYIELMNHGIEGQEEILLSAVQIAQELNIPTVATGDVHYINQEDAEAQDILLCISSGKFRTDPNRYRLKTKEFHLRNFEEISQRFQGLEKALATTKTIADQVDIELQLGERFFPTFTLPEGKSAKEYLYELCIKGLKDRYKDNPERYKDGQFSQEVIDRLERELYVINTLGFPNYFLIVWDFVNFAKKEGIQCTTRGSGVGALVSYALYLSHVCPLEYDLLFERFLDINRKEAPDIDIDFEKERRGEVIQYVKDKYGEANVAQIGTFGTLAARAALRDTGRALGMPLFRVDSVVAMVPDVLGISLDKALETSEDLKKAYDEDPEVKELLDLARQIEGLARNVGTHAAAVVIADQPLEEYVPLQHVTGKEEVITQWSMNDVEAAGLLKMDFLGLRNLTMLSKAVQLIESNREISIDPYAFPLTDKPTYALLCRGETKGVFQLESGGIRDLLQRMKPDHFRDIIATNALYRPGPLEGGMVDDYIEVKHGRQEPVYKHPVMEDVLSETNGVMVYQEQVMRILNRLGGIELSDAYKCIKAISKKKLPIIAKYKEEFIDGSVKQGLAKKEAEELFNLIEKFAGYGFNKSHSTAYALIAYMTAYLKTHYSVEFMASLLCSDIDGRNFKRKDSLVEHLEDCRRMQIEIMSPDVNSCEADFTVRGEKIYFGLSAIKGCGRSASDTIAHARKEEGPFRDLFDFCERVDPSMVSRSTIESLIKAGAFDSTGAKRAACMQVLERAMQAGAQVHADRRSGQQNLFGDSAEGEAQSLKPGESSFSQDEWPEKEKLANEKEVLGFYLTSHPLAEHEQSLKLYCTHHSGQVPALPHRAEVVVGGMLSSLKFSNTKRPRVEGGPTRYVMFDLEDLEGNLRCIVWPEQFAECGHLAQADAILGVRGKVDKRPGSDEANLIVDELMPLEDLEARYTKRVVVRVKEESHGIRGIEQLHEILRYYPGDYELRIYLELANGGKVLCHSHGLKVGLEKEMRERVEELLGPENFKLDSSRPRRKSAAPPAASRRNAS
ncbi:DNA polymerase III subunit alpha [Planctomycetales bacterium 10988]|nr:DNA polymerase III subunit alpha [Planctomycetales bacterium 10988]